MITSLSNAWRKPMSSAVPTSRPPLATAIPATTSAFTPASPSSTIASSSARGSGSTAQARACATSSAAAGSASRRRRIASAIVHDRSPSGVFSNSSTKNGLPSARTWSASASWSVNDSP